MIIADDEVSRVHAWIGFSDTGQVMLRDCDSANGTYVNQVRVKERILRPTDQIAIGSAFRHLFRVEFKQQAASHQ